MKVLEYVWCVALTIVIVVLCAWHYADYRLSHRCAESGGIWVKVDICLRPESLIPQKGAKR